MVDLSPAAADRRQIDPDSPTARGIHFPIIGIPTRQIGIIDVRFRSGLLTWGATKMPGSLSDIMPLAIRNPSRAAAVRLLSISDQGEIRGVVDPDTRDLFIWKATEAAHRQIAESIHQGVINRASPFLLRTWEQIAGHSRSGHASG